MNQSAKKTVTSTPVAVEELSGELSRMGGLVEDMLADSVNAVVSYDVELSEHVVAHDRQVDELQQDIERRIHAILGAGKIEPSDLRVTIGAIKIAADLERIGDLAKNIAKRVGAVSKHERTEQVKTLERMGRIVSDQLKRVLDAFSARDSVGAMQVWRRDEEVDEHYNALFRVLLTYMMEDPRTIGACTHLLFISKNLERMGDHCTNIAETIHFLVTGNAMTIERPKADDLDAR